ncbi:MAG TPA: PQQ-dependent sugar dehydrogenase [Spirochaetia bacterium]|nr:PQQ-dependent sugar dehydrogenase [Spirochaetia bacterium]
MRFLRTAALVALGTAQWAAPAFSQAAAGGLPFPLSAPAGFHIEVVSTQVPGARFLAVAPNGDVLVSEIGRGTVVAVPPGSPPGAAPRVVARGLEKPNGLAFRGNDLYIATWSGVTVIPDYPRGVGSPRVLVSDMPRNGDHNARALALAADGTIYISSGSDCNICQEDDPRLATVLRYSPGGNGGRIYASGLRNASGLAFDSQGRLWAVVNQRDNLAPDHTDLPPEELDLLKEGGDYGWPGCYPVGTQRLPSPEFPSTPCSGALATTFNFQAHSAPLQALFYNGSQFPARYRGAMFVAFHGSWNREPPTGYKVVAVLFEDGRPVAVEDFVTGWLTSGYRVRGRPVGLAVAADGSLYVSDDTGYLFRVSYGTG